MRQIYKHKMAAGALYRAELAYQLERRLGLEMERDPNAKFSFRLKNVSAELEDHFSTRRKEVEEHLAKRGLQGAVASNLMATMSRISKKHLPREELSRQWAAAGKKYGFTRDTLEKLVDRSGQPERFASELAAFLAASKALDGLTEHQSSFTKAELVQKAAEVAQTEGISADRVLAATEDCLVREVISLGISHPNSEILSHRHPAFGEVRYTTREIS